jgi:hypothetical protein
VTTHRAHGANNATLARRHRCSLRYVVHALPPMAEARRERMSPAGWRHTTGVARLCQERTPRLGSTPLDATGWFTPGPHIVQAASFRWD